MHQSIHSILSQTQLFDSISEEQLESIAAICESAVLPKGYVLIQESEASDALYIVGKGIRSATAKTTADDSFILRLPREALS